ncbi:hypothetical protein GE09DRAFT_239515 [Coniochaeta sp. 2T2.1]|nr:hypothetical protein GE09DRAFT_239515 [Coniochaeta sp. 2T2.1]
MKLSFATSLLCLISLASAIAVDLDPTTASARRDVLLLERQNANNGRPVPDGACCVAATSKKQDICTVNGQRGKCVPANTAGCSDKLTCIADQSLVCDPTKQENGRTLCRLRSG